MGWRRSLLTLEHVIFRCELVAVAILVIAMVAVTFGQVFTRYVLNFAPAWCEELARYLFIWVVFLGAPIGVQERGHMALKLVQDRLPLSGKRFCNGLVYAAATLFLAALTWQGIALVLRTVYQVSPTLLISMRWVYVAIPIGSLLMLFHLATIFLREGIAEHPLYVPEG
jgi:TRAP-type C4-dicarboxylate transport system permease small subunit